MTDRKQILLLILMFLTSSVVLGESTECPGNSMSAPYRSLGRSQMGISVSINHSGPYDFIVDTGAEMTVIDSEIAKDLKLPLQGYVDVISLVNDGIARLVRLAVIQAGPVTVFDLPVVLEPLEQIHVLNQKVRGILGENFLGRFDLLIDYKHKVICFDESKSMEHEIRGEQVPLLQREKEKGDSAYAHPLDIAVQIPDGGKEGVVLRVDSGTYLPILFDSRLAAPSWPQSIRDRQGSSKTKDGTLVFATLPAQSVKIGSQTTRLIAFLTPIITNGRRMPTTGVDGLLPTMLFKRVFVSYSDHFVIFDPR